MLSFYCFAEMKRSAIKVTRNSSMIRSAAQFNKNGKNSFSSHPNLHLVPYTTENYGVYTRALTRKISPLLKENALRISGSDKVNEEVDMVLAIEQHRQLAEAILSTGVIINELESDDLADSVFIEDTVVIVGGCAMITHPGAPSRQPETLRVRKTLEALGIKVIQQTEGTLDGGDVLFTGAKILQPRERF